MRTLLHSLFGRAENASGNSLQPAGPHSAPTAPPGAASPDIADRRQLVEKLLGFLLRRSGMPVSWVEPQMLVLSSRTRGNGAHLRLVLKQGDEQVLKYIFALQKQLQKDIHDADSSAPQWLQGISWQLDIDGSCQRTALPDKSFWQPVVDAQRAKPPAGKMPAATPQAVRQPAPAPAPASALASPQQVVTATHSSAMPGSVALATATATASPPLPLEALKALRQLREARAQASLPTVAASTERATTPAPVAAPAAAPVLAQPAPATASPAKTHTSARLAKPRLDYGSPNFECSRPAEETELTPDLAALFALDESAWKAEPAKG